MRSTNMLYVLVIKCIDFVNQPFKTMSAVNSLVATDVCELPPYFS